MNAEKLYTNPKLIPFFALLCVGLWGSAYPVIKLGYEVFQIAPDMTYDKLCFAGYRFLIASLILFAWQIFTKKSIMPVEKKDFFTFTLLAFVHTVFQFVTLYIGITHTTGINSSIIGASCVFINIVMAHFIYKNDRITSRKLIGCIVGMSAIFLMNFNSFSSIADFSFSWLGDGLVLLSTFLGSCGCFMIKWASQKNDVFNITAWELLIGSLILIAIGYSQGGSLIFYSWQCIVLIVYMALITSVALVVWSCLYKYNPIGKISFYSFFTPVFGVILSALVLSESLSVKIAVALALVTWSTYFVNSTK